jgi:two-component system response regulator HydG
MALVRFDEVTIDDLPEKIRQYSVGSFMVSVDDVSQIVTLDELTRRYALRVIALVGGNKSHAAQILGIDRRTLYRRLDRYATDATPSGAH